MGELVASRLAELLRPSLGAGGQGELNLTVARGLRGLVLDGRLVVGTRLASERALATELGLSRATVTAAYRRLRQEGFLTGSHGAGSSVSLPPDRPRRPDGSDLSATGVPQGIRYDLTLAALPAPALVADAAMEAAAALPAVLGGQGLHPLGLDGLRRAVAARFTCRGLPTAPEEVLITQGALHAWDLILRAYARPGDRVMAEQPTYPAVLDAALAHRVRLVPLAVDATGWDLDHLPARQQPAALVHVTPDLQNPTGHSADADERRELLQRLPSASVLVVDETFADLRVDGVDERPLAALAGRGRVLTVGSLSKSVWAGLRIGWVRGPRDVVLRLATARTSQDLATPVLEQLIAERLVDALPALLPERRNLIAARRDSLLASLAELAPQWTPVTPAGGLVLWLPLGGTSSTRLALAALENGVRITPGPRFSLSGTHDHFVRLPFSLPEPDLHEAVRLLAEAARTLGAAPTRPAPRPHASWVA